MGAKVPGGLLRNGRTQRRRGARGRMPLRGERSCLACLVRSRTNGFRSGVAPLISGALATGKHGKAVGPDAPSLPSFSRLEEYSCSRIWLGWQLGPRWQAFRRAGGEVEWLRPPRKRCYPSPCRAAGEFCASTWHARSWPR